MARILITGARGFIGSHLGNRLVELGHYVHGVDNLHHPSANEIKFSWSQMPFQQFLVDTMESWDAIVHLAAFINVDESIENPLMYMDNNAMGTVEVLEYVREHPATKLIFASSAEVYGSAQAEMMSEDHPLDPQSPYAVSKLSAEQMCKNYAQLYGLDITVIRNFNTFGEFQSGGRYGGVIAKFKSMASRGEDLTVYGSGEQMRDYMHISQAVEGYVLALQWKLPLIVNFGSGRPVKIIDIANVIANKFKVGIKHTAPRPSEIMRLQADVSRAKKYGYQVSTEFWIQLDKFLDS